MPFLSRPAHSALYLATFDGLAVRLELSTLLGLPALQRRGLTETASTIQWPVSLPARHLLLSGRSLAENLAQLPTWQRPIFVGSAESRLSALAVLPSTEPEDIRWRQQ